MPRKKKKGPQQSRPQNRRRAMDKKKCKWWQDRINAAIEVKKPFRLQAEEVDDYFRSTHEQLFSSQSTRENFMDFRGATAVSVPMSAQVRNSLGPHLYIANPHRMITVKGYDMVMKALAKGLMTYVNKTPRESKLERQSRRQIDDGLLRGLGFMRSGWDDVLQIITSWQVSSRDVLIDGSAYSIEDAHWVAMRRREPLYQVKRDTGPRDKWRVRRLKGTHTNGEAEATAADRDDDDRKCEDRDFGPTNDMVEIWDVYSKMGNGVLGADFPGNTQNPKDPGKDQDFVKISVAMTHDVLLFEGDWEVPLYLDREWPIQPCGFVETLDQLWPESVMGQVMPLQKAMDLLTSLSLISCRNRGRTIFWGAKNEEANAQKLVKGGGASIYIGLDPDMKKGPMNQRFGALDLGHQPPEIAQERSFIAGEFEKTTGLTSVVSGGEDAGAKDRSATASRLRSQATNMRLADMRRRVEECDTAVARNEALMVRLFFAGPEAAAEFVAPYVSPEDIAMFYVSIRPPDSWVVMHGVAEIPVRDRRTAEEIEESTAGQAPLTLELFGPEVATYFEDPGGAEQALMGALAGVEQQAAGGRLEFVHLSTLWDNTGGNGFSVQAMFQIDPMSGMPAADPMTGQPAPPQLPEGVQIAPVTVETVWNDTAGVSAKTLCRELSYEIHTSGGPEYTKEAEIELANTALQQGIGPAMGYLQQSGDPAPLNALFERVDEANGVPDEKRMPPFQPPPMPPPGAGPPQGGSK